MKRKDERKLVYKKKKAGYEKSEPNKLERK